MLAEHGSRGATHDQTHQVPEARVKTPYGLEVVESCLSCRLRRDRAFCRFSAAPLRAFSEISHPLSFPGEAILLLEGQIPRGVFVLCSGKAKISTTSPEGRVLMLKMVEPGEVLGLNAVVSGRPCELTVETATPCLVNFVEREPLLFFLRNEGEAGLHAAQALSREFQSVHRDIRHLVLARSSAGKLARLLLSWMPADESGKSEITIHSDLTHEEMAHMIGASRETVTRVLSELKKKQLIHLEGSTLVIRNPSALQALAA